MQKKCVSKEKSRSYMYVYMYEYTSYIICVCFNFQISQIYQCPVYTYKIILSV